MKDLRNKPNLLFKGRCITAGYSINELTIKEMLAFMGVKYDDELIQEAIGYFSSNAMEINMNNIENYLKEKKIISKFDIKKK